jgi:hypothetical protein
MKTFKVSSSQGHLIVDSKTGIIIECNSSGSKNDYLKYIEKFDVNRYKVANKNKIMPDDVDILRLAYWSKNNIYDTPAEGYEPISMDEEFFNKMFAT